VTKYDDAIVGMTDARAARFLLDMLNGQLVDINQRKCDVLTHLDTPKIPSTALALLIYLWDRRGRVVGCDSLCNVVEMECMAAGRFLGFYSLNSHIKRLRMAIAENGWPIVVSSISKIGYILEVVDPGWSLCMEPQTAGLKRV